MLKPLESTFELDVPAPTRDDFVRVIGDCDFDYFTSHFQQIVDKRRRLVPMTLNPFQRKVFEKLLPMVDPKTRLDRSRSVVFLKSRRVGATTGTVAFINFLLAYVEGADNLNVLHLFPTGDSAAKLYNTKVKDIVTGVLPELMPTIYKDSTRSSVVLNYDNLLGVRRHNSYELASAGANSLRGSDFHMAVLDECLSPNVEILTDKGFRRLDELDKTEKVAQFDCQGETISFVKPLRYIDRPYNGDGYEWEVNGEKFYSTARHAFVAGRRRTNWRSTRTKYKRVMAYEPFVSSNYDVPVWGVGISEDAPLTPLERLGIATQADGSVRGIATKLGKSVRAVGDTMCQMGLKKSSKIMRMRRLLEEAGVPYSEHACGADGCVGFSYSLPFADPKHLDTFLSVECSYSRAREIIHEVLMWDGYGLDRDVMYGQPYIPHNSYYSSVEKRNRDFVAAVALQGKIRVHCGIEEDNRSERYSTVYRLNMTSNGLRTYGSFKRTETNYEGRVYCVEVPTGCIVVKVGKEVFVTGNCSSYRHPEEVEAVVSPMMPPHGFSLTIYASTFDDKMGPYFKEKIVTALAHPEEYEVIFVPWYYSYPEESYGLTMGDVSLTEYDEKVVLPAMTKDRFPSDKWADSIEWYHRMSATMSKINMHKEFPTTIEEILAIGENKACFTPESLEKQEKNILPDSPYQLVTDVLTNKPELRPTEESSISIYRQPLYGHKYRLVCDPIGSNSEDSDFFAAIVWDLDKKEQAARIYVRGLPVEDLAELTIGLAIIYNRAQICNEKNMGQALVACIRAKGYYNFYYCSENDRKRREPGIRTTITSKPAMIDKLQWLLDGEKIIIHDEETLRQLKVYSKFVKKSGSVVFSAPKGDHDDLCMCCNLFAGSLSQQQLAKDSGVGFTIL